MEEWIWKVLEVKTIRDGLMLVAANGPVNIIYVSVPQTKLGVQTRRKMHLESSEKI